jgi:hypothetical protein
MPNFFLRNPSTYLDTIYIILFKIEYLIQRYIALETNYLDISHNSEGSDNHHPSGSQRHKKARYPEG